MQNCVTAILFILLFSLVAFSQGPPLREVKGQVLKSKDTPAVELEIGKEFKYVGGHRFILYDVATAEQHFFVDADKEGRVRRWYWVQFEGFLPTNDNTYKYKGTKSVDIGGLDFIADTYARNIKLNPGRPDSDGARGREFLASRGYRYASDEIISQRLLHFIGEDKRNELMIIYAEDLTGLGLTAADVEKGGKAEARWNGIAEAILARAQKNIKVRPMR